MLVNEPLLDFLAPGNVALAVLVGAGGAGFQMVQDIDSGFFDKLRVAPIPRLSIVAGLLATDAVRLATHVLVVTCVALVIGAKLESGIPGLLVMMLLGGFFGAMWSGISLNVALRTKNAEITGASTVFIFPLYFASTAFVPYDLLPPWLQTLNEVNPVSYLVDGMLRTPKRSIITECAGAVNESVAPRASSFRSRTRTASGVSNEFVAATSGPLTSQTFTAGMTT